MAHLDHGSKIIARVSGRALARMAGFTCRKWKPSESTVQATTERLADRVFEATEGKERFIVYFEFVSQWDASVPWSILGKSGMLGERERLPVVSLVFILQPKGYVPQNGRMQLTVKGWLAQHVGFVEKPLWEIEPEAWWEDEPGLMALYPLCRHQQEPVESVLHAASQIEEKEKDGAIKADLLTSLGIFGRLAYPGIDVLSLIGREKMKESLAYKEIMDEGSTKTRREDLLEVVASRFGKPAVASVKRALKSARDLDQLHSLFKLALNCSNLEQLISATKG